MKKILPCLFLTGLLFTACNASPAVKTTDSTKPSDKILDNSIFSDATSSGNLARCKDILDATLKASCTQVINDKAATSAALEALDKSLCAKVSDARYKQDCETQVAAKVEAKNADANRLNLQQQAYDKKDYTICSKIEDANQKDACMFNVIIELKDPSLCEKIGQKDLVAKCKNSPKS